MLETLGWHGRPQKKSEGANFFRAFFSKTLKVRSLGAKRQSAGGKAKGDLELFQFCRKTKHLFRLKIQL